MLNFTRIMLISTQVEVVVEGELDVQGVQQNSVHFVNGDFSASLGAKIKILDFFQQPFPCRI